MLVRRSLSSPFTFPVFFYVFFLLRGVEARLPALSLLHDFRSRSQGNRVMVYCGYGGFGLRCFGGKFCFRRDKRGVRDVVLYFSLFYCRMGVDVI